MRILFVAIPDSVHAARWVNQISQQGWDIHLFAATSAPPHLDFRNVTIYGFSAARPPGLHPSVRLRGLWPSRRGAERLGELISPVPWLVRTIRWLKPDCIHSLEFQHAGYLALEAKARLKSQFPPWIVTNWGSDIYLFGRLAEHAPKVKGILASCDYYTCECERDIALARAYGFKGEVLPVVPVGGSYRVKELQQFRQPGRTSARRMITLKGYQNWAGRALVGLRAIELAATALTDYRVAVYLAAPEVKIAAELISQSTGIPIEIVSRCPHEEILRLHGRARASIGLSISDAISTSFLEAIMMGSFPIQSNTGCGDEWVRDGENGLLVHPEDPEGVAAAIRRAVTDDELVDRAAAINTRQSLERLDHSVLQPKVLEMYNRVAAQAVLSRANNRRD